MTPLSRIFSFTSVGALAVAAYAYQASHQLTIDGKIISTAVVTSDGHTMVPVEDIAKYLGDKVTDDAGNVTLTHVDPSTSGSTSITPPLATTPGPLSPIATPSPSGTVGADVPGTAVSGATANLFPTAQAAPTQVAVSVGKSTSVNGVSYSVDSIQKVGPKYKLMFDQRGTVIHPTFKTDQLVIVDFTIENTGSAPISPSLPDPSEVTVFDSSEIGYRCGYLDVRQSSDLVDSSDSNYDISSSTGGSNLVLGPGGKLHFAAVASLPLNGQVQSVTYDISGTGMNGSTLNGNTIVTVTR